MRIEEMKQIVHRRFPNATIMVEQGYDGKTIKIKDDGDSVESVPLYGDERIRNALSQLMDKLHFIKEGKPKTPAQIQEQSRKKFFKGE